MVLEREVEAFNARIRAENKVLFEQNSQIMLEEQPPLFQRESADQSLLDNDSMPLD